VPKKSLVDVDARIWSEDDPGRDKIGYGGKKQRIASDRCQA
jgi:hypothetical protein